MLYDTQMKSTAKKLSQRRSIRIPEYDYRQAGSYFVTICTFQQRCILGKIIHEKTRLTPIGHIVKRSWEQIPMHFKHVGLDQFVVMPNHFHGILELSDCDGPDIKACESGVVLANSLSSIIRSFKANVTREIHEQTNDQSVKIWQRNYYEHVIRNERSFKAIQEYIVNNPLKWELDSLNPKNRKG